ncbi:MAG: hypothetical protein GY951_18500 [Psychromonas sp.]|nr:hypothetical protein [Alteromonadales bacterium]MCP5080022.1 hypothetical protein [Psychromonas sp.]
MRILIILISLTYLTACTNLSDHSAPNQQHADNTNQILIHQHITRLANKLFSSARGVNLDKSIAVGTFLPITLLKEDNQPDQNAMGLQIQESLVTLAMQAGLTIVEYKTMSSIKLQSSTDIMLSRDRKKLHKEINAQYFLTGTYSEQENIIVINARLIEISSRNIVAAATDYIPTDYISADNKSGNSYHNKQKVTMKNNVLHRKEL